MTSPFNETDFVDRDLQPGLARATPAGAPAWSAASPNARPPTREELETKVTETQGRIAELKRAQEELERQRVALEDGRRRRAEFETGRAETLHQLTRGVGLLEKAEFEARRDADQMARTLAGFRDALASLQSLNEQTWTPENWNTELTRALTAIENARMEWNAARLKWPVLAGATATDAAAAPQGPDLLSGALAERRLRELCRLGLALTWPLALVAALGVAAMVLLLVRR